MSQLTGSSAMAAEISRLRAALEESEALRKELVELFDSYGNRIIELGKERDELLVKLSSTQHYLQRGLEKLLEYTVTLEDRLVEVKKQLPGCPDLVATGVIYKDVYLAERGSARPGEALCE